MNEIVRYYSTDFDKVFFMVVELEEKILSKIDKEMFDLDVVTSFVYSIEDGYWEGELVVRDAKKDR